MCDATKTAKKNFVIAAVSKVEKTSTDYNKSEANVGDSEFFALAAVKNVDVTLGDPTDVLVGNDASRTDSSSMKNADAILSPVVREPHQMKCVPPSQSGSTGDRTGGGSSAASGASESAKHRRKNAWQHQKLIS